MSPNSSRLSQNGAERPHRGAEVEHGHERHAGNRERHDRGRMMMTHRVHVRPRLENLAVDDALRIGPRHRRHDRIGVEIVFEDVAGLHQRWRARAREKIALRVVRIAHADVAEGIENALVRDNTIGGSKIAAQLCERIGHETFPLTDGGVCAPPAHGSKAEWVAIFKESICYDSRPLSAGENRVPATIAILDDDHVIRLTRYAISGPGEITHGLGARVLHAGGDGSGAGLCPRRRTA